MTIGKKTIVNTRLAYDVAAVVKLLTRQRDLYKRLSEFSAQQAACVESGETEELLKVLSQRQYLVDALTKLNTELQPYRARWDEISGAMNGAVKLQVNGLVDEVERLLSEMLKRDDETQKKLELAKAEVGKKIHQTKKVGQVANAYRGAAMNAYAAGGGVSRYTDNRG
ncbi:hypothetical protein JD969_17040 [Planctomycetota bacterium]|nr:hypothetical protein JD969_17040 [Planctomycetota bacterium]